jgi:hypothetical protein
MKTDETAKSSFISTNYHLSPPDGLGEGARKKSSSWAVCFTARFSSHSFLRSSLADDPLNGLLVFSSRFPLSAGIYESGKIG